MLQIIFTGLTIGLVSGFHCVGMCGPIAFSLPVQDLKSVQKTSAVLLYNLGRIFTYTLLGLISGITGRFIYVAGFQQWLSIIMGVIFMIIAIGYFLRSKIFHRPLLTNFQNKIIMASDILFKSKKMYAHFLIGNLNGLLPCGMVYFAVTAALATGNILSSVLLMFFFGLGTLPLMTLIAQFGVFVSLAVRNKIKKVVPFFVMLLGILLIMRGLNLGIPFVSPELDHSGINTLSCH